MFPEIRLILTSCGVISEKYARGQTCCYGDWQSNVTFKIFKNDPIREFSGPKV